MTVGEIIKNRRSEKGLTLRALAEVVGVDHSYIGKVESGKKAASKELLSQLADHLELDKAELFRLQGYHAESKGTSLEKEYPGAVDILYSANKDLDVNGKKAMEFFMIQVKQALESKEVKQALESGELSVDGLNDDEFSKALLDVLRRAIDTGKQ